MPRDPGWIAPARLVLAIAGIVAVVAIAAGIKDYLHPQKPPASMSTPTVVNSSAKTVPKKNTSAKVRRARMSASAANAQAAADNLGKPLISKAFGDAGAKAQVAHDEVEAAMDRAAMDRNNRVRSQFDMMTTCIPLPNGTKPTDVDAPYYQSWAREYGCVFLPKSPPQSKPDSP